MRSVQAILPITKGNEMIELKINWGNGFEFYGLFSCEGAAITAANRDAPGREFIINS